MATWAVVPLQLIGLLLGGYMLVRPGLVKPEQRAIWTLLWAFFAMSALATYMWNFARPPLQREVLNWADLPYLAEYWLLTAVFVLLFKRTGGSFRQPRVWLDILTMLAVQLVGVWSFFYCARRALPRSLKHQWCRDCRLLRLTRLAADDCDPDLVCNCPVIAVVMGYSC